jgi:hypothetical protein
MMPQLKKEALYSVPLQPPGWCRTLRSLAFSTKQRMRLAADTEIVTAGVVVEVVIKSALLTVFKEDTDKTGPAHQCRRHFFHNGTLPPFSIAKMDNFFSESKV